MYWCILMRLVHPLLLVRLVLAVVIELANVVLRIGVHGFHSHRLHSSSFLGLPYRILYMNPQKELLWNLWVATPESGTLVNP